MPDTPLTYFDTPERSSDFEINKTHEVFKNNPIVQQLLDGFPEFAFILNDKRQVVASNRKITNLPNIKSVTHVLGLRIGEVFKCIHHYEEPSGCGTTRFCAFCGAAKAIRSTKSDLSYNIEECRITSTYDLKEISYDFLVHSSVLTYQDELFIVFAVRDISDDKRREVLERIFFHDVLNTSGAIQGIASLLLTEKDGKGNEELLSMLLGSADQLVNEIKSQRDLLYAEKGKLDIVPKQTFINSILEKAFALYHNHNLAQDKIFTVSYLQDDLQFETDVSLLVRSLGNLIKNALEAVHKGGSVKCYSSYDDDNVLFHVYNDGVIPENIQLQIFQRSFSTKEGKGRGVGTYSIKLIVEQYLMGQVYFNSDKETQTVFSIKLPKHNQPT